MPVLKSNCRHRSFAKKYVGVRGIDTNPCMKKAKPNTSMHTYMLSQEDVY